MMYRSEPPPQRASSNEVSCCLHRQVASSVLDERAKIRSDVNHSDGPWTLHSRSRSG